jgi:hypothetical protein
MNPVMERMTTVLQYFNPKRKMSDPHIREADSWKEEYFIGPNAVYLAQSEDSVWRRVKILQIIDEKSQVVMFS